jgi:hypothetical protein
MPLWEWLLDAAGLLLVLVLLYGAALVVRRRLLSRHGGTFELSYRARSGRDGRGWLLGVGRYSGERLEWFRVFSLSPRPKRSWGRTALSYSGSREPAGAEQLALYPDHVIVECGTADDPVEVAMSRASLMGFQAWLESSPPGADWSR